MNLLKKINARTGKFSHEPLDHSQASVRVIQVLPTLSPTGLIQCTIKHTTVNSSYICLSYRWCSSGLQKYILINGKHFCVRRNLWDFLDVARKRKNGSAEYWIDALCINQTNGEERNHQVAQMGRIYSCAKHVVAWLGANKTLLPQLRHLERMNTNFGHGPECLPKAMADIGPFIIGNLYWQRAWVVQEIVLARRLYIQVDEVTYGYEMLYRAMLDLFQAYRGDHFQQFNPLNGLGMMATKKASSSLTSLLLLFQEKKCKIPRDRIFSLISLCRERERLTVDYRSSDVDVALEIIGQCLRSSPCLCGPQIIIQALGIDYRTLKKQLKHEKRVPILFFEESEDEEVFNYGDYLANNPYQDICWNDGGPERSILNAPRHNSSTALQFLPKSQRHIRGEKLGKSRRRFLQDDWRLFGEDGDVSPRVAYKTMHSGGLKLRVDLLSVLQYERPSFDKCGFAAVYTRTYDERNYRVTAQLLYEPWPC